MKATAVLLSGFLAAALAWGQAPAPAEMAPAPPAAGTQVRTVYLLPMANGLDQHLAHQLTALGTVRVLADPKGADAVLTDRLGEGLQTKLDELYPAAKPEAAKKDEDNGRNQPADIPAVHSSSFGRAKGTVFLVSAGSREVLWSTFEQPKDASARELERSAERVARRLDKELKRKPAQ